MNTSARVVNVAALARVRVDHEDQEAVVKLDAVRENLHDLEQQYRDSVDTAEAFAEAIKAVAEESGLFPKVLRRFVIARVKDQIRERKRECDQLFFLFDEIS